MATLEKTAEAVEGFEGLKPADLEARRKAVAAEWTAATRGATELNEDGSFVESEASEKDRAKADVLRGQYHNIVELQAAAASRRPLNRMRLTSIRAMCMTCAVVRRWTLKLSVMLVRLRTL